MVAVGAQLAGDVKVDQGGVFPKLEAEILLELPIGAVVQKIILVH